jgi:hypothetical protein
MKREETKRVGEKRERGKERKKEDEEEIGEGWEKGVGEDDGREEREDGRGC